MIKFRFFTVLLTVGTTLLGAVSPAQALPVGSAITGSTTISISPSVIYQTETLKYTVNGVYEGPIGKQHQVSNPSCYFYSKNGTPTFRASYQAGDPTWNYLTPDITYTVATTPVVQTLVEEKIWLGTTCGGTSPNYTAPSATPDVTFSFTIMPRGTMNPATPAAITPTTQTVTATQNSAISATTGFTAAYFASTATYSVAPALPAGLTLNTSTGVITGTPTLSQSLTTYTVTGTDGSRTATATIDISVASLSTPASGNSTSPSSTKSSTLAKTGAKNNALPIGMIFAGVTSVSLARSLRRRSLAKTSR